MSILLFSSNLMTVAPIRVAADRIGATLASVSNVQDLIDGCELGGVELILLDLSGAHFDPRQLVPQLKERPSPPAIIAFGPHVHEQVLSAASESGCDEVFTQGQMLGQASAIIGRYAGKP